MKHRVMVVHFSGDFRAAWRLREETGAETYYSQGYMLDQIAALARKHGDAAVMCALPGPYEERLPSGAIVMGAGTNPYTNAGPVIEMLERFDPTHLIVHGPMKPLLEWGKARGIPLGCVLADSFYVNPVLRWWRWRWLAPVLNDPAISLVANHGINAARGLVELGVDPAKVIAWDFPHARTPDQFPAKTAPAGESGTIFYVGSIERKKGVGDLIAAVARLRLRRPVRLRIAGAGKVDKFKALARRLGVAEHVEFLGLVPNSGIPAMMQAADVVVVPSRHSYSEGLPLTLYEALASRTPTVASDHPMFAGHLTDRESALIFPSGDSAALADRIETLLADHALYEHVSRGSEAAWNRMQIPVKWGEMVDHWVCGGAEDRAWLAERALTPSGDSH